MLANGEAVKGGEIVQRAYAREWVISTVIKNVIGCEKVG
jgi:hypothetical protein